MFNINEEFDKRIKLFEKVPFLFILLFIATLFWVTGSAFFENWSNTYEKTIAIYIGLLVIFLFFARERLVKVIKESSETGIPKFVLAFFGTFALMIPLIRMGVIAGGKISPDLILPTLIIQICVVAASEEIIFRGVVLDYAGIWVSAIIFGVYHSAAYGILWYNLAPEANLTALGFAIVFGLILGVLAKYYKKQVGISGCVGIHACYNLAILGVMVL